MQNDSPIPEGFSRAELVAEVKRELTQRERVYPHQIALGKLTSARADRQKALLRAVLQTLEKTPDRPAAQGSLLNEASQAAGRP